MHKLSIPVYIYEHNVDEHALYTCKNVRSRQFVFTCLLAVLIAQLNKDPVLKLPFARLSRRTPKRKQAQRGPQVP
jgi:hypothetical protein